MEINNNIIGPHWMLNSTAVHCAFARNWRSPSFAASRLNL